jgi:magnesium-protoporphyrin IX monomethyl ester (oxidative) cyclase
MHPTDYDMRAFRITSEISRQVFPVVIDIDNPTFLKQMERLRVVSEKMADAKVQGGLVGRLKRVALTGMAAVAFGRLYMMPAKPNALPRNIIQQPAY